MFTHIPAGSLETDQYYLWRGSEDTDITLFLIDIDGREGREVWSREMGWRKSREPLYTGIHYLCHSGEWSGPFDSAMEGILEVEENEDV